MINHFNFAWKNGEVLLTNDFGEFLFLSKDEFQQFVTGSMDESSESWALMEQKGFVTTKDRDVFINERVNHLRSMKSYLFSATALHIFAVTNRCNQSCVYCQAKAPTSTLDGTMSLETGKRAIEVAMQSPAQHLTFEFQGGEPLLNFPVILGMIEYSKKLNETLHKDLEYTIVTNLVAMKEETLQALIQNNVSICTSLDGCAVVHNHNRPLCNGGATYNLVKRGIDLVRQYGQNLGAIETTTRFSLAYPKEIIDTYAEAGMPGIFLRPLTPLGFAKADWEKVGYSPEEFLVFYKTAFDHILEINRRGQYFPELNATYFLRKMLHGSAVNYMELRSPCGAGVGQMSYYYNGNVYTCDEGRMMGEAGNDAFLLGNVHTDDYEALISHSVCRTTCAASVVESLPKCCDCVYHPYCGVCPVVAYSSNGDIFPHEPFDFRCKIHQGILDILFDFMQQEDPEIMSILHSWISAE